MKLHTTNKATVSKYQAWMLGLACTVGITFFIAACAKADSPAQEAKNQEAGAKKQLVTNGPPLEFRGTISGDVLDMAPIEDEVVTDEAKHFKATGEIVYRNNQEAIKKGYTIFATACAGCHGHLAEGKLGPALADDYWTYPKNETDQGLFETIYGGAAGMMGPQQGRLTVDEIIHVIAWIRWQHDENLKGGAAAPHS